MKDKFKNVPVEADTKIGFEKEVKLGGYDALYQGWTWDGIYGESIILKSEDVAKLTDDEINQMVKTSPFIKNDSITTFKRTESGFIFVNFNFITPDD